MDIPEAINTGHHLVVVAARIGASTEQIVDYVRGYGVPINVLFFEYLRDGERLLSNWMAANALVCWTEHPELWTLEEELIARYDLPLNFD